MKITPFKELVKLVNQLEKAPIYGHHRIYSENKIKEAIATYNRFSLLKYICFKPRYRQLIKKAQQLMLSKPQLEKVKM